MSAALEPMFWVDVVVTVCGCATSLISNCTEVGCAWPLTTAPSLADVAPSAVASPVSATGGVVSRPMRPGVADSVNQMLPSGPTVIPSAEAAIGEKPGVVPARELGDRPRLE